MFISIDTFFYAKSTTGDPGEVPQNSIPTKELRRALGNIHQAISPCEQGGHFLPNLGKQSIHGRSGYENKNHSNRIPFLRQFNPNMQSNKQKPNLRNTSVAPVWPRPQEQHEVCHALVAGMPFPTLGKVERKWIQKELRRA